MLLLSFCQMRIAYCISADLTDAKESTVKTVLICLLSLPVLTMLAADQVKITLSDGRVLIGEYNEVDHRLISGSDGVRMAVDIDPDEIVKVESYAQPFSEFVAQRQRLTDAAKDEKQARRVLVVWTSKVERLTKDLASIQQGIATVEVACRGQQRAARSSQGKVEHYTKMTEILSGQTPVNVASVGRGGAGYQDVAGRVYDPATDSSVPADSPRARAARLHHEADVVEARREAQALQGKQQRLNQLRLKEASLKQELDEARKQLLMAQHAHKRVQSTSGETTVVPTGHRAPLGANGLFTSTDKEFPDQGLTISSIKAKWLTTDGSRWKYAWMGRAVNMDTEQHRLGITILFLDADGFPVAEDQDAEILRSGQSEMLRGNGLVDAGLAEQVSGIEVQFDCQ